MSGSKATDVTDVAVPCAAAAASSTTAPPSGKNPAR